jgi:hypothetical protein
MVLGLFRKLDRKPVPCLRRRGSYQQLVEVRVIREYGRMRHHSQFPWDELDEEAE